MVRASPLNESKKLDEQFRILQATTKELEEERASRRGDSAEAGKEPESPAIAAYDIESKRLYSAGLRSNCVGRGAEGLLERPPRR